MVIIGSLEKALEQKKQQTILVEKDELHPKRMKALDFHIIHNCSCLHMNICCFFPCNMV